MTRPTSPRASRKAIGYRVWSRGTSGGAIGRLRDAETVAEDRSREFPGIVIDVTRTEFSHIGMVEQDHVIERWRAGVRLSKEQFKIEGLKIMIRRYHHAAHAAKTWEELLNIEAEIAEAHATIAELEPQP